MVTSDRYRRKRKLIIHDLSRMVRDKIETMFIETQRLTHVVKPLKHTF